MSLNSNVWAQILTLLKEMAEKKTTSIFIEEMHALQPNIEVVGEYEGARIPIKVHCKKCGHIWDAAPTNLLKGRNCPKCSQRGKADKRRKPTDVFLKQVKQQNGQVDVIGEYVNDHTKILVRCKQCKYEWSVIPSSLLRGSGCPRCARTGTSWVEQIILLSLEKITGEKVLSRNRSAIGLELDIYIPELKFAVEYGAWPWHEGKEEKDKKKLALAKKKGIHLIEIFDAYTGKATHNPNVWTYKENISRAENIDIVKNLIRRLCKEIHKHYTLSDTEFDEILSQARLNSRKMTTADLNKKLTDQGIKIQVLSEYEDMLSKVEARCLVCGNHWNVIPASLLRGLGCPECANKRRGEHNRKTQEQFEEELYKVNPDIKVLGKYTGNHTPIKVKCMKHGTVWDITPGSLLRGAGCKLCMVEKIKKAQRKTTAEFKKELKQINPNIIVKGEYANNRTRVRCKCKRCGNEWDVLPDSLLRGEDCPVCARKAGALKRSIPIICVETNTCYSSSREAGETLGINPDCIRNCIRGTQKTAGGFHWKKY